MEQLAVLAAVGLALIVLGALRHRRRIVPEMLILILLLLAHAVLAVTFSSLGGVSITSGSATTMAIDNDQTLVAANVFLIAALTVLGFALLLRPPLLDRAAGSTTVSVRETVVRVAESRPVRVAVFAALVAVAAAIALSFDTLVWRDSYQFAEKGSIATVLLSIALPAGIFGAVAISVASSTWIRFSGWVLLGSAVCIEISRASRSLAVLILAAAISYALLGHGRRAGKAVVAALGAGLAVVALITVIQLRGTSTEGYGLIPAAMRVVEGSISFAPDRWASMTNNLVASIPITYLSSTLVVPEGFLLTSLSPEQGTGTAWYEIAPYLSIAAGVPTNAVGQIASLPLIQYLLAWGCICVLLALSAWFRGGLPLIVATPMVWVSMVLVGIASLQMLQYSLRAASRFIWLSFGLTFVAFALFRINHALGRRSRRTSGTITGRLRAEHRPDTLHKTLQSKPA